VWERQNGHEHGAAGSARFRLTGDNGREDRVGFRKSGLRKGSQE